MSEIVVQIRNGHLRLNSYFDFSDFEEGEYLVVEIKKASQKKVRTLLQNSALHLYLKFLAMDLNNSGFDMRRTLKPDVEIPWNTENAKEYLWRPIQVAVTDKESSTKLTTKEISEVYETISRHLAKKFGITTAWPDRKWHS